MTKELKLNEVLPYFKALHCGIRWDIIEILKDGPLSSDEIYRIVTEEVTRSNENNHECEGKCHAGAPFQGKKSTIYYHLRELEDVGIIKVDQLRPSKQKKAPEKIWKLNIDKLIINLREK